MDLSKVQINGNDLSQYGVRMLGSYAALLAPAENKPWVENDPTNADGVDYIVPSSGNINVARRTFNLTFYIKGDSEANFLANYKTFVGVLQRGMVELYVPDLNHTFSLKCLNCTPYDTFGLLACKLAVKFEEPKPLNYATL